MTEYDFSPEAYERHLATQNRIANWVGKTEEHRPQFVNALMVPPSAKSSSFNEAETASQRPSYRRHRSSDALRTYANVSGMDPMNAANMAYRPEYRSQPQSRSSSRHRSSSKQRAAPAALPTYVVKVPKSASKTYVYAPPGWVPSQGLVVVSSSERDVNLVVSFEGFSFGLDSHVLYIAITPRSHASANVSALQSRAWCTNGLCTAVSVPTEYVSSSRPYGPGLSQCADVRQHTRPVPLSSPDTHAAPNDVSDHDDGRKQQRWAER